MDPKTTPPEIVSQPTTEEFALPYDRFLTSSPEVKNINPTMQMTSVNAEAMALDYPSPSLSASPTNNNQDDQSPYTRPKSQDSIYVHRRRPGRPSKAQISARNKKRPSDRMLTTIKRQVHNDTAMRSRARFNTVLDELWEEVPKCERSQVILGKADPSRSIHRADRIEIVIFYLRKLRKSVKDE